VRTGYIKELTVTADGRWVSSDGRWIHIWDPGASSPSVSIDAAPIDIQDLCVSRDGKRLVVMGGNLAIYSLPDGEKQAEYREEKPESAWWSYSPDCLHAFRINQGDVQVLELGALPLPALRPLISQPSDARDVTIKDFAVSGSGARLVVHYSDFRLVLYDRASGKPLEELQPRGPPPIQEWPRELLFTSEDSVVGIYSERRAGQRWTRGKPAHWTKLSFKTQNLNDMALSPDGRTLAVTHQGGVDLVDLTTWQTLRTVQTSFLGEVAWDSPKSLVMGTFGGRLVRLAAAESDMPGLPLLEVDTFVSSVTFSPDGAWLLQQRREDRPDLVWILEVWDWKTGQRVATAEVRREGGGTGSTITFVPGSQSFYWMDREWVKEGAQLRQVGRLDDGDLAVSADGKVRAFAFCDALEVRDAKDKVLHRMQLEPKVYAATEDSRGGVIEPTQCDVELSADGSAMMSRGWNEVRLWDPRSGKLLRTHHESDGVGAELSKDGRWWVSWGERELRLWDAHTGKLLRKVSKGGWEVPVLWTEQNAAWLARMSRDAVVNERALSRIDLKSGKRTELPELPFRPFRSMRSPDHSRAAFVSSSGAAELRDAKSGEVFAELESLGCYPRALAFSPRGDAFALACEKGGLALWELPPTGGP
jgi:WD40 repeat protein